MSVNKLQGEKQPSFTYSKLPHSQSVLWWKLPVILPVCESTWPAIMCTFNWSSPALSSVRCWVRWTDSIKSRGGNLVTSQRFSLKEIIFICQDGAKNNTQIFVTLTLAPAHLAHACVGCGHPCVAWYACTGRTLAMCVSMLSACVQTG